MIYMYQPPLDGTISFDFFCFILVTGLEVHLFRSLWGVCLHPGG